MIQLKPPLELRLSRMFNSGTKELIKTQLMSAGFTHFVVVSYRTSQEKKEISDLYERNFATRGDITCKGSVELVGSSQQGFGKVYQMLFGTRGEEVLMLLKLTFPG